MLEQLKEKEREQFADVVNKLLSRNFVLEKVYNSSKSGLSYNPEFRFIEIHKEEIETYLKIANWELQEDRNNGIFSVENNTFNNYIKIPKFTTIVLLILRILYDKKQQTVSLDNNAYFTLSEILEEGSILGVIGMNPSKTDLSKCMSLLSKYQIVNKIQGNYDDVNSMYLLYPTILHVINSQNVLNMIKEFSMVIKEDEETVEVEGKDNEDDESE